MCISFYNLQISCSFCNRWKSKKDCEFDLYTDNPQKVDVFRFEISDRSLSGYINGKGIDSIEIKLKSIDSNVSEKDYNSVFHIDELYESFKDDLLPILCHYQYRNNFYQKQALASFKRVYGTKEVVQLLYGFNDVEEDVYKHPLSKLKRDVAKQLNLI